MKNLLPFDNKWKEFYAYEKALLLHVLKGQKIVNIEHVGATSVVMCGTCGTIDVLCGIQTSLDFITIKNILVRQGYTFIENQSDYLSHLLFVRRNPNKQIVATIRLVEYGSDVYNRIMAFKYYLKERDSNVRKYNEFRSALLEKYNGDMSQYQIVKSDYIESILNDFCVFK